MVNKMKTWIEITHDSWKLGKIPLIDELRKSMHVILK